MASKNVTKTFITSTNARIVEFQNNHTALRLTRPGPDMDQIGIVLFDFLMVSAFVTTKVKFR